MTTTMVPGQEHANRALEVAAAGGFAVTLSGYGGEALPADAAALLACMADLRKAGGVVDRGVNVWATVAPAVPGPPRWPGEPMAAVVERVAAARACRCARTGPVRLEGRALVLFGVLERNWADFTPGVRQQVERIAGAIADLEGGEEARGSHVAEALVYRLWPRRRRAVGQ